MDPISAATGIIGLFSTCRDCYLFFSKLNNADNDMRFMIDDLDIEAAFLKSWGCYWGIHPPGLSSSPKLEDYLKKNPYKQYGVAKILLRIGELMTDDEELLTRYGVKLMLRDGQRMVGALKRKKSVKSKYLIKLIRISVQRSMISAYRSKMSCKS